MNRWIVLSLCGLLLAAGYWSSTAISQTAPPTDGDKVQTSGSALRPFMRQKLEHAKGILEGLALEDYELVGAQARQLSLLSMESSWNVLTTEEYLEQSAAFRRATNAIAKAAGEKDIDRAALGYVDLTVRCVECHRYLRNNSADISATKRPARQSTPDQN